MDLESTTGAPKVPTSARRGQVSYFGEQRGRMRVRWRWMWVGGACFVAALAAGSCQLFVDGDIALAPDASVPVDGLGSNESSDDGGEGDASSTKDGYTPPLDGPATDAGSTVDAARDAVDDTAETSPPCGAQGQICCADASCQQTMGVGESTCSNGMCVPCGTQGQTCCGGSTCANDFMCTAGSCAACGTQGLPCCTSSTCNMGLACSSATCV